MRKLKFQIKGMHCNSCAVLIEEKLKGLPGVASARVNFDSRKGVVVFDQNRTGERDIEKAAENVGDYEIEKIEESDGEEKKEVFGREIREKSPPENGKQGNYFLSKSFLTGLLIGIGATYFSLNLFFNVVPKGTFFSGNVSSAVQDDNSKTNQNTGSNNSAGQNQAEGAAVFNITSEDHIRGDFGAPITLVEFSDFECPFCERHYPTMNKILSDYNGKVRLVYKHFPLGFHSNAQKAAEASECADEQGKFWEYHDKLFENQANGFGLEKFKQWAKELSLNSAQFNNCLDSGKYAEKVQNDFDEGQQKAVQGTPATFVNGQLIIGALPYETFKGIIDNLLTQ